MTAMDQASPHVVGTEGSTAFARELQLRVEEAAATLAAAEAQDDPLLAQIAEADLADLRALADKNDVQLG